MTNSISKIEPNKINSFGKVHQNKSNEYWLTADLQKPDNSFKPDYHVLDSYLGQHIFITPEEARKTNNLSLIGLSIAGVTVLTAAALFFVLKGGTKGVQKYFQKIRTLLERKVQRAKLEKDGKFGTLDKAYIYVIKSLDLLLKRSEAINNFTSFKDLTFKKIMNFTGFGGKIHDRITNLFEKIGRRSVLVSYKKTDNAVKGLKHAINLSTSPHAAREFVTISGQKVPREEALKILQRLNNELVSSFDQNFGQKALQNRYFMYKKSMEDLKSIFKNLKIFWSKNVYSKFMAESAVIKDKIAVQDTVKGLRRELSYSTLDMAAEVDEKIMKMTGIFSYKDADKIKRLRAIRSSIRKYAKNPSENSALQDNILSEINSLAMSIKRTMGSAADKDVCESLLKELSGIRNDLIGFKQGKMQDILDIYRQILPEREYKAVEKSYKSAVKSLDKSIKIETEDFVSKLRDLTLGSAPTDILTILGSLGVLGYHLGKSDNNDQRISISLKYGIPALAGIGTALYCNAKLYAGSKSLIFGTVSTFIVNKIGVILDNMRKKNKQEISNSSQAVN